MGVVLWEPRQSMKNAGRNPPWKLKMKILLFRNGTFLAQKKFHHMRIRKFNSDTSYTTVKFQILPDNENQPQDLGYRMQLAWKFWKWMEKKKTSWKFFLFQWIKLWLHVPFHFGFIVVSTFLKVAIIWDMGFLHFSQRCREIFLQTEGLVGKGFT